MYTWSKPALSALHDADASILQSKKVLSQSSSLPSRSLHVLPAETVHPRPSSPRFLSLSPRNTVMSIMSKWSTRSA